MADIPGYTFIQCLHEGTAASIYRALRNSDNHQVVIKISSQKYLSEKKAQRFNREFEIGQTIESPYVVKYLDFKQDPSFGMALIMEDDQAVQLASILPDTGFSVAEFLPLAMQIVQGLQAIHAANITHNDLKLSNILIQPQTRQIKLIDFNRASSLRQERQPAVSIQQAVGTLAYLSPEQTGRINRLVDYRTDFYSLGVMFYQLLSGQLPFAAKDALGLIHQHLAKPPALLHKLKPAIPLPLSQLILKLLEKEPENRYQCCEGLLHDLKLCQQAWQATCSIPAFELGQQDVSNKLTLSQRLYGREVELKVLMQAFDRVGEGNREMLLVAGQPGVGKSMLIQEIQKPITLKQGYFISGKFDQMNRTIAYSAITQAFDGLIQQLLTEEEVSIAAWKQRLQKALGAQAQLMVQVVPTLERLIGQPPPATIADPSQAKTVFNLVFMEFLQVFAEASHPLVLFLDDLQWADSASLELMTYLLTQPSLHHLLWLGAYRDTEISATHPASQAITAIQAAQVRVQTLTLAPLGLESLQQWLADSLHMANTTVQPLAELIQQKTAGNPFFVKLFLQSLYNQQLLTFSSKTRWQWDLVAIRQHPATENVISLMTYQLKQLSDATQQLLSVASCLGHRVALSTLQMAMAQDKDAVCETLQPALNSNILIQSDGEVLFTHDRVQEAAYSLFSESTQAQRHLIIGRRLLVNLANEEDLLFDIISQHNRCRSLITDPQERLQLAKLNFKAGQKAKQATAYAAALNYLYESKVYVDSEQLWQSDYPLAFGVYKTLAETEYLSSHLDTLNDLIEAMWPHLQSTLEKVEINHLLILQKTLQSHYQEAVELGNETLQLLGNGLPLEAPTEFIHQTLAEIRHKLAGISLSSLLDKPCINDPEKKAVLKILVDIYGPCYMMSAQTLPVIILSAVKYSLDHGHVPESCMGYAGYGILLCAQFHEYALGYEFGNLAIQLAEKLQEPSQHSKILFFMLDFIYGWTKPLHSIMPLLNSTYDLCLGCGELQYAGYLVDLKVRALFEQGAILKKVQQEASSSLAFVQSTKNQLVINIIQGIQQVIANLMGDTADDNCFDTELVTEANYIRNCHLSSNQTALYSYYLYKAEALFLHGYFELAFDNLLLAGELQNFVFGTLITAHFNWYDSLTRIALYPSISAELQPLYLQQVMQNQQQLQKWAESCPENFAHKYLLVQAELARVKNEPAEQWYEQAVTQAGQHGFIQEQALAAERAATYWLERGIANCAQGYLNLAFNGYKLWGAKRKVAQLKTQHAELLKALAPPGLSQLVVNQETTLSGNILKLLDLSSILKASQAISSEMELAKLLHSMMQIIIENAGAQMGAVLLVEPDETLVVQAEYGLDSTITTLQHIPLTEWQRGAPGIVQYVKSLHQSVVIDNALTDTRFNQEPYLVNTQAKSVLAVPVLKQDELKAILYAENNLLTHAFTPERVQTIQILTAQMAISIENARYFAEQLALNKQLSEQFARAQAAEEELHAISHNLQLALEASKAGTWNWWAGVNKVTWDKGNCALFGIKPEEFKGTYEAVLELVHPDDRDRVAQGRRLCIEQDCLYDMEFRVIWPDGSEHVLASRGRLYRDRSGQPIKMAGVNLDMTQHKQLEQERQEALKKAEEERIRWEEAQHFQQRQKEYTDTVSHELRNPLQGLIGTTGLLGEELNQLANVWQVLRSEATTSIAARIKTCQEYLDCLEVSINHLKTLIDDVLNLSKLEAQKMELEHQAFQPKTVIYEIIKMYQAAFSQKHLSLTAELPAEALRVKGDAQRIRQVLINLVANALKFTEQGSVTIGYALLQSTATHAQLQFTVKDTGIGLTVEERSRLFQRFSQASAQVAGQYGGTGLGLEISDKLVKLMGGQIEVSSEKGKGTQFSFVINCEKPMPEKVKTSLRTPEEPQAANLPPRLAETIPAASPSKKILIVDDNVINQKVLTMHLKKLGYESIVLANNGQEAVQYFQEAGPFGLILMDMEMPVLKGDEATKQIRQQEQALNLKPVPIICLTGHTEEKYHQAALTAGMNAVLTKPFKKEQVQQLAETWLTSIVTASNAPTIAPS